MKIMRSYNCEWYIAQEKSNLELDVPSLCDFSATSGEFAWVNELSQDVKSGSAGADISLRDQNSQFYRKKTQAFCREVGSLNQNLNNGRSCQSSFQCNTGVCKDGECRGLQIGANCHSHIDCAEGLFCEKSKSWPFANTCTKLRTSYQICEEDAECVAGAYCWYASAKNVEEEEERLAAGGPIQSSKQCLPYYSYSS